MMKTNTFTSPQSIVLAIVKVGVSMAILFLVGACAHTRTSSIDMGVVPLKGPQCKMVIEAVSVSKAKYYIGIGGLRSQGLVFEAKRKLIGQYPLLAGQSYQHVTLDIVKYNFLVYAQEKAILTAEIWDCDTNRVLADTKPSYQNSKGVAMPDRANSVYVGDSVLVYMRSMSNNLGKGIVIGVLNEKVWVNLDVNGHKRKKWVMLNRVLPLNETISEPKYAKFKVGAETSFHNFHNRFENSLLKAKVLKVCGDLYLLEYYNGKTKEYYLAKERELQ